MDDQRATRRQRIEAFAALLQGIRDEAGSPSYRSMAAKSGVISHTALYEAAAGNRLPSWSTTVEFLRACDRDPETVRADWETARAESSESPPSTSEQAAGSATTAAEHDATPAESAPEEPAAPTPPPPGPPPPHARSRRTFSLTAAVVVVAVLLSAGVASAVAATVWRAISHQPEPAEVAASAEATEPTHQLRITARDCPVAQSNPPSAPPATEGDRALFLGDITAPDCSHVRRGAKFTKVWRLKNAGKVTWKGYYLDRLDGIQGSSQCDTAEHVPIPTTAPGKTVDIRLTATAPNAPGFCFVRFKVKNATGDDAFPAGRPINFQVIVD